MVKQWCAEELLTIGRQNLRIGQYEAAKQIGCAVAQDAQLAHAALALIGDAFAAAGELDDARQFYEEAIATAVRGGHFADKVKFLDRMAALAPKLPEIGVGSLRINRADDTARIAVAEQSKNNLYRMIRNVLWQYGFEDVLVQLFDKVPATENDMSWRQPDTASKQRAAIRRGVPAICINTLPKSGTMFLLNTFSKALNAPFVRISVGLFPEDQLVPSWADFFCRGGCISVQHMDGGQQKLKSLRDRGLGKIWAHVRDPRQTLVSMYHHSNSGNTIAAADIGAAYYGMTAEQRVEHHIGDFPKLVQWIRSWKDAAENKSHGLSVLITRHEDLRRDAAKLYDQACAFFDVDRRLFSRELIMPPKSGNLHFRKGETDEWRSVFTTQQQTRLNDMLPDDLLQYFGWAR